MIYSWDNIAHIKALCNVDLEAPDNNTREKILFIVVLMLMAQSCTGQNPMQCCLTNPVEYCLNTPGTTLQR